MERSDSVACVHCQVLLCSSRKGIVAHSRRNAKRKVESAKAARLRERGKAGICGLNGCGLRYTKNDSRPDENFHRYLSGLV